MKIDLVPLPRTLTEPLVRDRIVVVFDVLRATTTIAAALAAGAREIRIFDSIEALRQAASNHTGEPLLCGERHCLPPPGFDLGNSPGAYVPRKVHGKTLFFATTNGTRAVVAAKNAAILLTGALVNASAVGSAIARLNRDVTLLCAGTDGESAPEDELGAGAVLASILETLPEQTIHADPAARKALLLFQGRRHDLHTLLKSTQGGRNVIHAGLPDDPRFASQLNIFDIVAQCDVSSLTIRPLG